MVDEVINREVSNSTAMVVGMVLLWSLLANYLQRFNNSYWFFSDSILATCIGFLASIPLCSYDQFQGGVRARAAAARHGAFRRVARA